MRQLVGRDLGADGYRIESVASVTEALDLFDPTGEDFDLRFADVPLPDGSGNRFE